MQSRTHMSTVKEFVRNFFGTRHDREVKRLQPVVNQQIAAEGERLKSLSDEELRAQTERFRALLRERTGPIEEELNELKTERRQAETGAERQTLADRIGDVERKLSEEIQRGLDDILPEAFATVREAARRLMGTEVDVTGQKLVWDMIPYDVQLI